jgi:hypothetical protein
LLDDQLQDRIALARIRIALARIGVDAQAAARLHPAVVGEPAAVREQHARRDRLPARVAGEVGKIVGTHAVRGQRMRQQLRDGRVEVDPALVGQLQQHVREGRLREGAARHDGVRRQRLAEGRVARAHRLHVHDLPVLDRREGQALHLLAPHRALDFRIGQRLHGA